MLAVVLYIAVYALLTAISVPGAAVLTMAGGFLFGTALGTACHRVRRHDRRGRRVPCRAHGARRLSARPLTASALERDGGRASAWTPFNYLLALRLMPLFPFFLVNIAAGAFLGVPLRTYVLATLIGIIPGSFVFTSVGAGLGSLFDKMQDFSLEGAMTAEVVVALSASRSCR